MDAVRRKSAVIRIVMATHHDDYIGVTGGDVRQSYARVQAVVPDHHGRNPTHTRVTRFRSYPTHLAGWSSPASGPTAPFIGFTVSHVAHISSPHAERVGYGTQTGGRRGREIHKCDRYL